MILESALSLSLAVGADLYTTEKARGRGYGEHNTLCGSTKGCVAYSAAYATLGTIASQKMERGYGKKWGRITLGVFCALPLGAALHNEVKMRRKK